MATVRPGTRPRPVLLLRVLPPLLLLLLLALTGTAQEVDDGVVGDLPSGHCVSGDRDALVMFRDSMDYYPGTALSTWTDASPCCSWVGVSCRAHRVEGIALPSSKLEGSLPVYWSNLAMLESLDMKDNKGIQGSLPDEWSVLRRLFYLDMGNTGLNGHLPRSWSVLTGMNVLRLAANDFSGSLPAEYSALSQLQVLYLLDSNLVGTLPASYSTLVSIKRIELRNNRFSGTLPAAWSTLTNLEVLTLEATGTSPGLLRGTLPESWSLMQSLFYLNVEDHQLTGTLPHSYSHIGNITNFSAGGNRLTGTLPEVYTEWINLGRLSLGYNQLSGALPEVYGYLNGPSSDCEVDLWLAGNRFTGSLPERWSLLTRINGDVADLLDGPMNNSVLGAVFPAVAKTLISLTLQDNLLTGTLPASWSTLAGLKTLHLDSNRLASTLPAQWQTWTNMKFMNLSSQPEITGNLPKEWSLMTKIDAAYLDGTSVRCSSIYPYLPTAGQLILGTPNAYIVALAGSQWYNNCVAQYQLERSLGARIGALIGIILASVVVVIVLAICIIVPVHRRTCVRQDCAHRHPGFWHSFVAHFGIERRSHACPVCSWGSQPDLSVDYKREISHLIREERFIGGGSFGWVYRAQMRGCEVAIKVMSGVKDEKTLESFRRELEAGQQFRHCPRVARVLGACMQPPHVCIISEYLPGGTLNTRIHTSSKGPMAVQEVLQTARDIAEALSVLHPSYTHRDLKPENILLDADDRPKLIDFGLGRQRGGDPFITQDASTVQGTPAYMAPEMFDGKVSEKVDIYALGIIMCECLSREKPFASLPYPSQICYAVSVQNKRPDIPRRCPDLLARLIQQCWDANPLARPDAADVRYKLDFILGHPDYELSVSVHPPAQSGSQASCEAGDKEGRAAGSAVQGTAWESFAVEAASPRAQA